MNLSEMEAIVTARAEESATNPVYWVSADVQSAIQEGYQSISEATEWFETNETLGLTSGITYHNLQLLLTYVPLRVTSVWNTQTSQWMTPVSVRDLDREVFEWEDVGGEPEQWFIRGIWTLGTWPVPDDSSGSIQIYYTALPTALTATTEPGFPEEYQFGLIEYALYEMFSQEAETRESLMHWERYLAYEKALKKWVDERTLEHVGGWRA